MNNLMANGLMKVVILFACTSLTACSYLSTGTTPATTGVPAQKVTTAGAEEVPHETVSGAFSGSMDEIDKSKLSHALDNALGKSTHWVNASTNVSYTVTPTDKVTVNGNPLCRRYSLTATRDGHDRQTEGTACVTKKGVESNIVWDYPNHTLPRYLRDIVITEYGIADCRSKTDAEVIKAMLNVADSRFQPALLAEAKKSGKIPYDYPIPEHFKSNYPERLMKIMRPYQSKGYFSAYPFGSDLTEIEQTLQQQLLFLKNVSKIKLFCLIIYSFFIKSSSSVTPYLERMSLMRTNNIKEFVYKKLLQYLLIKRK